MKITNIYKTTAALIFLMVAALWPAAEAWGQAVKGDKYLLIDENSKVSTYGADITAKTSGGTNASGGNGINNAFDGNDNTWWASSRSGTINIDIDFNTYRTIRAFHFLSGGNTQERENELHVYSSTNGSRWELVESFAGDRTVQQHDYCLKNEINTRYLRLQLVPGRDDYELAMNEITLYSDVVDYSNVTIQHKAAKWFDLRSNISEAAKNMDTFNDETPWYSGPKGDIQASHVYMDTIYVHKGTSVTLAVPDRLSNSSVVSYQRWYSYRTDGTFRTQNTGSDEVWDLLTPLGTTPCRFANGYVGKPLTTSDVMDMRFYVPKDEEFEAWFGETAAQTFDNNYYLVGCDVSGYTDFTMNYSDASGSSTFYPSNQSGGLTYEPTLTHRIIYYIIAVDGRDTGEGATVAWKNGVGRLKNTAYQGGTTTGKYLEEYDISFPFTRISNNTKELVALSKDARSYAIPDAAIDDDNDVLDVKLVDNGSRITLATTSLSGTSRIIQFNYPNPNYSDGTEYVNANNSTATIYVTKTVSGTTYNIAKYNLTFVRDTRLLTQTQLEQIENGTIQDNNLKYYQFRTDKYLSENYQLLTKLDFDYDPSVSELYGQPDFYQFPLNWTSSSYSFYDGADGTDFKGQSGYFPEWGYYSIMDGFIEDKYWTSGTLNHAGKLLPNSTYHMFIDASDRAGVIARLPFRQNLCAGSEMFVTAWVKSAGYSSTTPDAGMLFSVMGVKKDEATGQDVYVPIYRHASSQIRRTDYLTGGMPGTGTGTNEWLQMYFSFIVENDALYDSYVLQVDNNSESTQGGDMYIDDIRVYLATPSATVTQLEATCTNERTRMNIKMDWDRLLSRRGETELSGKSKWDAIDFCFIDTLIYHNAIEAGLSEVEAIEASIVKVGSTQDGTGEVKFASLYFNLNFTENKEYGSEGNTLANQNLVSIEQDGIEIKDGNGFYSYEDESGQKFLSVDFYSELSPYRPYMMLISPAGIDGVSPTVNDFEDIIGEPCGIMTDFWVESQNIVKMNGEIIDPNTRFCAGQIFNFSVQLSVPIVREDGAADTIYVNDGVYFDWFFGETNDPETEFTQIQEKYGVSIEQALKAFRAHFPDATTIDDTTPAKNGTPEVGSDVSVNFSEEMRNLLLSYIEKSGEEDGLHNRLILHRSSLDITLLQSGLRLVVSPIQTNIPPGGYDIDPEEWAVICWNYIPLMLETSGESPQLHLGFNDMNYPEQGYEAALRIGLKQIERANSESSFLQVNLRGATFVSEVQGAYMSPIKDNIDGIDYLRLYLVDTNDPQYPQFANGEIESIRYDYPIGTLHDLHAMRYETGQFDNWMNISFDTNTTLDNGFKFDPREGYWYRFVVYYEERVDDGSVGNACQNSMNVLMKVVPKYLVWDDQQKSADYSIIGNWNNDGNWKRADKSRLLKDENDSYPTNQVNGTENGFVPMLFSKVIMPKDSKVELYAAGSSGQDWITQRPSHIAAPTDSIQYDLMAFESGSPLKTERYRVSLLNQIHFEPGAEMLHAEYLLYDTAWVDYQLDKGRWYTLASPLKAVYAGDFYTDKSGTEGNEYFQPIYYSENDNSRFNPSVYQRGWKGNATLQTLNSGTKDVAISGNWSALYNDVAEAYTPGTGFSLKVQDATGNVTFRLPKADGSYKYYPHGDGQSDNETSVSRVEGEEKVSGRLQSDQLFIRNTDIDKAGEGKPIEITLSETAHGDYYLVGNPFMAHLDMEKFFEENTSFAEMYWLVTENGQEVAVGGSGDGLISTGAGQIAPLQSFFVKLETDEATGNPVAAPEKITFTQEMQTLGGNGDGLRSASALTITATTSDGRTSRAAVAYDMAASADYEASEDAELFLDSNLGDVPMVYTVAGTMATSINRTSELYNIPLGVYGNKQEMVTLSFGGLNQFSSATLYDAQEQTETPLREGKTVSVPAGTSGRYFLRAGTPTGNEVIARNAFLVYSVGGGKVMVTSSNTPLKDIRVYTMGGAQVRSIQASGMQQEIYLNRGIYLITVSDQDGLQETRKVLVR